jgi:hypothetical protein
MKMNNELTEIKGNKVLRIAMWGLCVFSNLFLLGTLYLILFGERATPNIKELQYSLLVISAFIIAWNVYVGYMLLNIPLKIVLYKEFLEVIWSKKKSIKYNWIKVEVKTIGLNPNPMIIIKDDKWKIMCFLIPRILFVSRCSDKYRLLKNLSSQEG